MEALAKSVPLIADFLTSPQFWLILGIALVLAGPLGMIPGVGSLTIAAILVPFAILNLDPVHGVMLVAAIISLANTMDSVPAILLGYVTAPTQVTFLEGHQLAQRGEAARALGAVYAVSTIGGVAGAIALALLLPVVRPFIIRFSFPEITAMALFGILMVSVLSRGAFVRGLAGAMLGLIIATIGLSAFSAQPRFTFDILYLNSGLPIIPVVLGLFALPEVLDLTMTGKPVSDPGTKLSNRQIWEGIKVRTEAVAHRYTPGAVRRGTRDHSRGRLRGDRLALLHAGHRVHEGPLPVRQGKPGRSPLRRVRPERSELRAGRPHTGVRHPRQPSVGDPPRGHPRVRHRTRTTVARRAPRYHGRRSALYRDRQRAHGHPRACYGRRSCSNSRRCPIPSSPRRSSR